MSLVFDQRATLGNKAGMHALIIGVSDYPYLPYIDAPLSPAPYHLTKLSSPALAAYRVYEWLTSATLPVPLATCRLLLLPSALEVKREPKLSSYTAGWGLDEAVQDTVDWRNDASVSPDGYTFFYFAGHGAQRTTNDAVMLLPEFAKPNSGGALARSIDTSTIRDGMAPSQTFANIARTQFYFVDACRIQPEEFTKFRKLNAYPILDAEWDNVPDDRSAPMFYAAVPGTTAIGLAGQPTLFCQALLQCTNGVAGEPMEEDSQGNVGWRVSVNSLTASLVKAIDDLNLLCGTDQQYLPGGDSRPADLCYLSKPPKVDVTLQLDPETAANASKLLVTDYRGKSVWEVAPPLNPLPLTRQLDAGTYSIDVSVVPPDPKFPPYYRSRQIMPPRVALTAKLM